MRSPRTVTELMCHLKNDCNIQIEGTEHEKQLISLGYYHGYKGYRFARTASNRLPYRSFDEIVAVIEYDSNIKAALFPVIMFIETATKNIVCNESLIGLDDCTYDAIFKERMTDNSLDRKIQAARLKLRNDIYSQLSSKYHDEDKKDNKMITHFINRGEDIPLWAIFEMFYMGQVATYFRCLNTTVRESIMKKMNLFDASLDTNRNLLANMIYTIKSLRNAVAHNNVVFDTRFKDRNINPGLKRWIENETNISNITLYHIVDYIIIICCLLKRFDYTGLKARVLLETLENENEKLRNSVNDGVYSMIISGNVTRKINALKRYIAE